MATCKLIIRDEVNCKIEGLDLDMRKRLVKKFKYEIPYARHLPAVRLGRWDGCVAFFQLGGSSYVNLLPEILAELELRNVRVSDIDDQRRTHPKFEFTEVKEDSYAHMIWSKGHPAAGQPIMLRDYQIEIINNFLREPQCLQEVATGAGKTIMTAVLSQQVEHYGRSIVIVPNKSLVTQTEADYKNMQLDVGVYFGDRKEMGKTHTICTWQSLNNMLKKTKEGEADIGQFLEGVICVIVDEVHQAKADALKTLLTGVMSNVPLRWGLTGTIPKEQFEFQALRCGIGEVINRLAASTLQEAGHLAQCHVKILQTQETQDYKTYQSEMQHLVTNADRLQWLASTVESIRDSGNTLILVDRITTGKELETRIRDAVFVSGSMNKAADRKEQYDEMAESSDKVIVATYGVAAVGINIPRIFNLVLLEPGKSFVRVIQSIGRGIRKAEDKDFVQIWDITSACKFSKRHLTKRKTFYKEANYPFSVDKLNV